MNRRQRSQLGQLIVILALAGTALIAGVGLAVDVVVGYFYGVATARAADAAALSGVVFMPDQFDPTTAIPAGSRNDASDRAIDEAGRNGFDVADTANGISIVPSRVAGHPNRLQVTVVRLAPVFFMEVFGFHPYPVAKTAVATYLPPISLGQPGSQLGSSLGDLGRTRFIVMRTEGWGLDRGIGDAYTPNPLAGVAGASNDVHHISAVNATDLADPTLADRGGYNYRITVPSGGSGGVLQVYNAAFSPDGYGPTVNRCDNNNQNPMLRTCSADPSYWLQEEQYRAVFSFTNPANYSTMRYSLYRVNNMFVRTSDVLLSQLTVYPIDARNWSLNQYRIMGGPAIGQLVTQQYAGGLPANMLTYHNWIDAASYAGPQDNGGVSLGQSAAFATYDQGGVLVPGTYRLRVDTLDNTGRLFTSPSTTAEKAYAVRVLDAGGSPCASCEAAAWDDMCMFTPFNAGAGGSFSTSLFQLTPDYAGLTITIDLWDVGDISSTSGTVRINILDPTGAVAQSSKGINIYDLGAQRSNLTTHNYIVWASAPANRLASFVARDTSTSVSADNKWVHLEIPIPSTYNPPPGQYWWSLQYVVGPGTVAADTLTVAVGLKGGPVHLIP